MSQQGFFDPSPDLESELVPSVPTEAQMALNGLLAASKRLLSLMLEHEPERAKKAAWINLKESVNAVESLMSSDLPFDSFMNNFGKVGVSHPSVSRKAARTVRSGTQRHHLLWLMDQAKDTGMTSYEATIGMREIRPEMSPNQTATRMGELRDDFGYVEKLLLGGKVITRMAAKSEAEVYVITHKGKEALNELGNPNRNFRK